MDAARWNARANAYLALSILATDLGDNEAVCPAASESMALARKSGDKRILSHAMAYLASGKANSGQMEEAFELAQQAIALARECGNLFAFAFSHTIMAEVSASAKRDYAGALAYAREALRLAESGGYRWGYAMTVFGLGFMARTLGDYHQARERFRACLPAFVEIGDKHRINMVQSELGHIEREQGHYELAIPIYRETILEWQRLGHRAAVAHQLECLAFIAKGQEQVERAVRLLGAAQALRERINIAMTPPEQVEYARQVNDLKANLDEHEFSSLWEEGHMLAMEQAIQFALEEASE
jgi:tetratricopeptide (TPR) repeat protein